MKTQRIGDSDLEISVLSLGTMTFGGETTPTDAEAQMDFAVNNGINLIDTAEIYPAPLSPKTYGDSETLIGNWITKRKNRSRIVLSTKAAGPGDFIPWVRGGRSKHNKKNLFSAIEGSLQRLKTDHIDLFHLHWPDRAIEANTTFFTPPKKELKYSFEDTIQALEELTISGKIRFVGLSNESPWGTMQMLKYKKLFPSIKIISIQSPYNLLNRDFEFAQAEVVTNEKLGLISYSPFAGGLLTDTPSYSLADIKRKKRRNLSFQEYCSPAKIKINEEFRELSKSLGIELKEMALNFILSRPFISSTILGSKTVSQLKENLSIIQHPLPKSAEKRINKIYKGIYD
mgnify:CR=1 FL=1